MFSWLPWWIAFVSWLVSIGLNPVNSYGLWIMNEAKYGTSEEKIIIQIIQKKNNKKKKRERNNFRAVGLKMRNDDGTTAEEGFSLWMDWRDQIMSTSTGADSIDFIFNGRNLCCVCIHSTGEGEVSFQRTFWRTSDRFYFKCSKICRASSFRWKVLLMSKEPSRHHPKMAMTKPMKPQPKTCSKDPQKDLKKKKWRSSSFKSPRGTSRSKIVE